MTATTHQIPPTARQREILVWLDAYIRQHGFSPTIRELCLAFGFKSPNGAVSHLLPLKRKGWVHWQDGRSRTLRIMEGADLGL